MISLNIGPDSCLNCGVCVSVYPFNLVETNVRSVGVEGKFMDRGFMLGVCLWRR